jgi:hypothetical protein
VLGTAAYLAPEQARGEESGPSADLYALGVVTYQLISGRLPYEATSLTELALKQQREAPAMLDTLVAAVTPELADAVAIALALDPRERYQSARDMARALSDGAAGVAPPDVRSHAGAVSQTGATSLLSRDRGGSQASTPGPTAATRAVTPRRPRPGPRQQPAVAQAAPVRQRRRRASGGRSRVLPWLLGLLALALAIIAVVLLTAPAPTRVVLRNVVYSDVERTASALQQLVSENTK